MIEIHYRYDGLDGKHEYSVVLPFSKNANFPDYWNFWVWFYIGNLMNGDNSNPKILPFANDWDKKNKIIKVYKGSGHAKVYAEWIINFIKKHYSKRKK